MVRDSSVRVYLGTRKGSYVVKTDRKRRKFSVARPAHEGRDVFHVAPDPRRPGDVYAAVNSSWFGSMLFRSGNYGAKWTEVGTPMMTRSVASPPADAAEPPGKSRGPIVNLWHIEPGPESEPNRVYVGVDPAALYVSDDRGDSWEGVPGINEHATREKWNPGAGGMCLHNIILDPENPKRMYIGISAAGTFRSDDGGATFRPMNRGVVVSFLPEKNPEFGQCVHHVAMDGGDGQLFYRQDHDGIYVSHDRMESWTHVGKALKNDFGFVTATPRAQPGTAYFMPVPGSSRVTGTGGFQVYRWTERDRRFRPLVRPGQFPGQFGTHREGLAVDALDPAGIYVGTTTGQLFVSPDAGKSWSLVPYQFPGIHSVSVGSPASSR
jgi:hypothetical protein